MKKKNSTQRYAFIGWVVALIAFVAVIGLLLFRAIYLAVSAQGPQAATGSLSNLNVAITVALGLTLLGLAVYAILDPEAVLHFFTGRQARYGSNMLVMSVAFLAILTVVNVLVFQNPYQVKDFTEDQQHTLAPETLQTLAALPGKVSAVAFFSQQTPSDTAQQTLAALKAHSAGKFDYRFVDPTAEPLLARQDGVTGDGKIVLLLGDQKEVTADATEQEIVRALVRLMSPAQRTVYFLTGHGEADINGTDNTAMSRANQTLQSRNFSVKTLSLATTLQVPSDAKAIVIAGPKSPLLPQEVSLLQAYLDKGGAVIVMEDPTPFTNVGASPDPLADYLKTSWGISLDNDVVIDTSSTNAGIAIADSYSSTQPITQSIRTITILPEARSLTVSKTPPAGIAVSPLMSTTPQGQTWGETDFASLKNNQVSFDTATDIPGPLTLAASADAGAGRGRVVVFGNSAFANDTLFDQYANGDIFVNAVNWAVGQQNLLNITTHQAIQRTFIPPSNPVVLILILLGTVCVIPGLIVGAGFYAWMSRRRQG